MGEEFLGYVMGVGEQGVVDRAEALEVSSFGDVEYEFVYEVRLGVEEVLVVLDGFGLYVFVSC